MTVIRLDERRKELKKPLTNPQIRLLFYLSRLHEGQSASLSRADTRVAMRLERRGLAVRVLHDKNTAPNTILLGCYRITEAGLEWLRQARQPKARRRRCWRCNELIEAGAEKRSSDDTGDVFYFHPRCYAEF